MIDEKVHQETLRELEGWRAAFIEAARQAEDARGQQRRLQKRVDEALEYLGQILRGKDV